MSTQPVEIVRYNNLLYVPINDDEFLKTLHYHEMRELKGPELKAHLLAQQHAGKANPIRFKFDLKRVYLEAEGGGIICQAGLTARVCEYLAKICVAYVIKDTREQVLPPPDYSRLMPLRGKQSEIIAAVTSSDHGLIDYPTGSGKTYLIAAICALYPDVLTLIVTPGKETVRTLAGYMGKAGLRFGVYADGKHQVETITITTPNSLGALQNILGRVRLFIFDEVYRAAAKNTADQLGLVTNARMFGFADGTQPRRDGRNMVIECFFGRVIAQASYAESVDEGMVTPISVLGVKIGSDGFAGAFSSSTAMANRKRRCYWRNAGRNKALAKCVEIGTQKLGIPFSQCQILILCETTVHALELQRFLPDFIVCHGGITDSKKQQAYIKRGYDPTAVMLTARQRKKYQKDFESGTLLHAIATTVWAIGVDFVQLPLLIRADAMTSKISSAQLPGRLSRLFDGKQYGLLIDTVDKFNPWAEKRSTERFTFYRNRLWQITIHPEVLSDTAPALLTP